MTDRVPDMPSPFNYSNNKIDPNPRTVRGSDMTWFNTSGNYIIKNDYTQCKSTQKTTKYPWNMSMDLQNQPFNLKPWGGKEFPGNKCDITPRFDLYGHSFKCLSALNTCGCKGRTSKHCPILDGTYYDPN